MADSVRNILLILSTSNPCDAIPKPADEELTNLRIPHYRNLVPFEKELPHALVSSTEVRQQRRSEILILPPPPVLFRQCARPFNRTHANNHAHL